MDHSSGECSFLFTAKLILQSCLSFSASVSRQTLSSLSDSDRRDHQHPVVPDIYDEIPEVREEYDIAPDFQRIQISGQDTSGVGVCLSVYVIHVSV